MKQGKQKKKFNLYQETDIELTRSLPQNFLSLSVGISRQLVHLHQLGLVDGDGSGW